MNEELALKLIEAQDHHSSEASNAEHKISELTSKVEESVCKHKDLTKLHEDLHAQFSSLNTRHVSHLEEHKALKCKLELTSAETAASKVESERLQAELLMHQAKHNELSLENATLLKRLLALEQIEGKDEVMIQLAQDLSESEKVKVSLQTQLTEAQTEAAALYDRCEDLREQHEVLQSRFDELEDTHESKHLESATLVGELTARVEEVTEKHESLYQTHEELKTELYAQVGELKKSLQQAEVQLEELKVKYQALQVSSPQLKQKSRHRRQGASLEKTLEETLRNHQVAAEPVKEVPTSLVTTVQPVTKITSETTLIRAKANASVFTSTSVLKDERADESKLSAKERSRRRVIEEILSTELTYHGNLMKLDTVYVRPLEQQALVFKLEPLRIRKLVLNLHTLRSTSGLIVEKLRPTVHSYSSKAVADVFESITSTLKV